MHINLTAYEGVESIERFSPEELKKYCDDKLKSCDKRIAFLKKHFSGKKLNVLEVGSGSGKLLFRLEKEGMLNYGLGLEVSKSRCTFARVFSEYCDSKVVDIKNEDFLSADFDASKFDLVIGIDVVTNLIGAIEPDLTSKMLIKAKSSIASQGSIVLELMTCEREINLIKQSQGGAYRTWKKFDDSDPFMYGLDEISIDVNGNVVWDKNFVSRDGSQSNFKNILKPFSESQFSSELSALNMVGQYYSRWSGCDDTSDQEYIVIINL